MDEVRGIVTVAIVGKYTGVQDSYISVVKALSHAAVATNRKLEIRWINSEDLENDRANTEASTA